MAPSDGIFNISSRVCSLTESKSAVSQDIENCNLGSPYFGIRTVR